MSYPKYSIINWRLSRQAFPQLIRKKKRETKDYKIKIFVIVMFFMIIFLVSDCNHDEG